MTCEYAFYWDVINVRRVCSLTVSVEQFSTELQSFGGFTLLPREDHVWRSCCDEMGSFTPGYTLPGLNSYANHWLLFHWPVLLFLYNILNWNAIFVLNAFCSFLTRLEFWSVVPQPPVRRQIKAKPAGAQPCGVTSATARRILQSLERMSSPLAVSLLSYGI